MFFIDCFEKPINLKPLYIYLFNSLWAQSRKIFNRLWAHSCLSLHYSKKLKDKIQEVQKTHLPRKVNDYIEFIKIRASCLRQSREILIKYVAETESRIMSKVFGRLFINSVKETPFLIRCFFVIGQLRGTVIFAIFYQTSLGQFTDQLPLITLKKLTYMNHFFLIRSKN